MIEVRDSAHQMIKQFMAENGLEKAVRIFLAAGG
jgi:Fe-S cluster assembly iron-binding protein IscA